MVRVVVVDTIEVVYDTLDVEVDEKEFEYGLEDEL
jgi:hypothetical protein